MPCRFWSNFGMWWNRTKPGEQLTPKNWSASKRRPQPRYQIASAGRYTQVSPWFLFRFTCLGVIQGGLDPGSHGVNQDHGNKRPKPLTTSTWHYPGPLPLWSLYLLRQLHL